MNKSNEMIHSFYKAARRAGFASNLSQRLDQEIAIEEQQAPLPSARTPRTQPRMALELPPESKCTGGMCYKDISNSNAEQVVLNTDRQNNDQKLTPEQLAHKYFSKKQIEALKMARLQEVAESDRQVSSSVYVQSVRFLLICV